jgi:hypothetical protein
LAYREVLEKVGKIEETDGFSPLRVIEEFICVSFGRWDGTILGVEVDSVDSIYLATHSESPYLIRPMKILRKIS